MFTLIIKETKKRHYYVMSRLFSVFLNVFLFLYFTTFQLYAIPFDSDFLLSDNQYKAFQNIRLPFDANQVNTVFQDNQGLIWIGTRNGLFNYDGYNAYRVPDENGYQGGNVFSIIQLDSIHLCIGTDTGLSLFNLSMEQYSDLYPGMENIKSVHSLTMFDDKLWIGSHEEGLSYYDFNKQLLYDVPLDNKRNTSFVYILEPTNDKLYIGSYHGLSVYDPVTNKRRDIPFSVVQKHLMVNSLLWDKGNDCIWIGTEGYLFQFSLKDERMKEIPIIPSTTIKTLSQDVYGNLIIGTDNGLYIYNKETGQTRHLFHDSKNGQSLCNNIIWCSYVDRADNVWLGTDYGLSLALNNPIYQFIHISEMTGSSDGNQFTSIYKDNQGNYWFGGTNGLIVNTSDGKVRWYRTENKMYPLQHNRIRHIYEDKSHILWIATDGGIARYNSLEKQFVYYTIIDNTERKNARWAYDIYEDNKGKLWIATYLGGLFVVDKFSLLKHNTNLPYIAELNFSDVTPALSDIVHKLQPDKNGNIWANTQKGLVKINSVSREFTSLNVYLDKIAYDGGEYLWYTSGNVLYRLNISTDARTKVYEFPEGNQIYSLTIAEHQVCMASTEGITFLDCNTFQTWDFNVPNYCYQSCYYDSLHNCTLWGGNDGIIYFPSYSITRRRNIPQTAIMSVWANNKKLFPQKDYQGVSVRHQDYIELPYSNKNIIVEISDLSYSTDNAKGIYYRLNKEGAWTKLYPKQNRISFVNLRYGNYLLEIRNGSSDDISISPITAFTIKILPPWYASTIAYFVYSLLFIVLLFFIIRNIRSRYKRKYEQIEKTLDLSNLKMDFFIHISHELKTPLSLIIAPLASLIGEMKKNEYKQKLELIYKNAVRLNILIHKILDFKQMEYESEETLVKSTIELCSFVQSILDCFSSSFEERKIQIIFNSNKKQIWLEIDTLKIETVLFNIITNAVKHIPDTGGKIEISLTQKETEIVMLLCDTGTGIAEEDLPYVFTRFFQSKSKTRRGVGGSGIGLYMVKKFIELHDGRVEIESDGQNCGTLVRIILPVCDVETPVLKRIDLSESPQNSKNRPTLLIIDDNIDIVSFLVEAFSNEYNCLKALNGKDGLEIACKQVPDIIIVDQMMPVMDGLEFSKSLRRYQPTASIPLIMLTVNNDMETEIKSIKAGVDVFMSKPFDINKLTLRLHQLLQSRCSLEKKLRIENIAQPADVKPIENEDELFLVQVIAIIEEHLENTEFNVSMLSELLDMDKKQVYRKLKLLTGITPVEYIRQIRLKKAAMLLSQKKLSVSEVMYMVGFSNASYFSKCFLAEFKVTPTQYMSDNH